MAHRAQVCRTLGDLDTTTDSVNRPGAIQHTNTCYTTLMTSGSKNNKPASASELWRNRLNKTNPTPAGGGRKNADVKNTQGRFQNVAPGGTARKAKKGHRPG